MPSRRTQVQCSPQPEENTAFLAGTHLRRASLERFAHFFLISEMIVAGSSYWNIGIGLEPGDVEKDEEGIRTMKLLGQNMAWLLKKLHAPS